MDSSAFLRFAEPQSHSKPGRVLLHIAALLCLLNASAAVAQTNTREERTADGCVYEAWGPFPKVPEGPTFKATRELSWSGRCLNGKLHGYGEITDTTTIAFDSKKTQIIAKTNVHALNGQLLGFARASVGVDSVAPKVAWWFYDGQRPFVFNGLGLNGYMNLLSNQREHVPQRALTAPAWQPRSQRDVMSFTISSGEQTWTLWGTGCVLHAANFPECPTASNLNSDFRIFYFDDNPPENPLIDPTAKRPKYCPAPRDVNSCSALVGPLTEPLVKALTARVNAFFDRLDREPTEVRGALREYGQSPGSK